MPNPSQKSDKSVDRSVRVTSWKEQFEGLDRHDPSSWPALPKSLLCLALILAIVGAGWLGYWRTQIEEGEMAQAQEYRLRNDYVGKVKQAVNLEALKRQKEQVATYVNALEKQLPSRAEMDALLSDINQAGIGRGLQFELFRPGQQQIKDYYAELPIQVRVIGSYHDVGAFVSDVANMPRIVTLHDLNLNQGKDPSTLSLELTAKTFRYLDPEEIATNRREQSAAKKAGKA